MVYRRQMVTLTGGYYFDDLKHMPRPFLRVAQSMEGCEKRKNADFANTRVCACESGPILMQCRYMWRSRAQSPHPTEMIMMMRNSLHNPAKTSCPTRPNHTTDQPSSSLGQTKDTTHADSNTHYTSVTLPPSSRTNLLRFWTRPLRGFRTSV